MKKRGWIERLALPGHLAPDIARGVRGALAMLVPFYLARELGRAELAWAALGGWLGALSDPGGARASRALTLGAFTFTGALIIAVGEWAGARPWTSMLVLAAVAFGGSLVRAIGATGAALGTPFVVVAAIAVGTGPVDPLMDALGFAGGATWAVVLSSVLWPVWPLLPLRVNVASAWRALAGYVRALERALRDDVPPHDRRWAQIARAHQRRVRTAIESARSAALVLRARRAGETVVGSNLLALVGSAEEQLRLLVALAVELELRQGTGDRSSTLAALARLASVDDEIARVVSTPVPTKRRALHLPRPSLVGGAEADPLVQRLVEATIAAADLVAGPGASSATAPDLPASAGRSLQDHIRALCDAICVRSTFFHHAVRVTIAVLVAQAIGHALSPDHVAWVTVTTVAVLQPYPGATVKRALERAAGTVLGGIVALGVIVTVHHPVILAALLVPLGVAAAATRPRSHRLFVFFLTPLFVLMAERWQGDWWTAAARVGDALLGAGIAVAAALVFPSREHPRLVDALRTVLVSLRDYARVAIEAHVRGRSGSSEVRASRRAVGVALGAAETSLERLLAEPLRSHKAAEDALLLLTYARRLSNALTRLDVAHEHAPDESAARTVLAYVEAVIQSVIHGGHPPAPPEVEHELLARIVRQAELVGSRRLCPRFHAAQPRRRLAWAAPWRVGLQGRAAR